jgi:hypothetical protein
LWMSGMFPGGPGAKPAAEEVSHAV